MFYVSLEWLAVMAGTFSLYWLTPDPWRRWTLVVVTGLLLAYLAPLSAAILVGFTATTCLVARQPRLAGWMVVAATLAFVAVLGLFKFGARGATYETIVNQGLIPLGLSYYTFRCLHLIYERYRGNFAETQPAEIVSYLFFLPTLLVGPIHRFGAYQRDLYRVRLDRTQLGEGLERILYGYVKIAFLGNYLINGQIGEWMRGLQSEHPSLYAYLWIVLGGCNLYVQFSGFADIAIGFARLLGFRVIENFNWPYLSRNLSEFWQRWHVSLTSWCRDYVYGSVVSLTRSPALGALATLMVIGLWHELSLRYICWGLFHGFGLIAWQRFQGLKRRLPTVVRPPAQLALRVLSTLFTLHYVWFGFAIVRQPDLAGTLRMWHAATIGFFL